MANNIYVATPEAGTQPEYHHPPYASSVTRCPRQSQVPLLHTLSERTGPVFGRGIVRPKDSDLTAQHAGEPIGERIVVHGRVLDEDGCPVRGAFVEIWQANAAGRYRHRADQHHAPLDPNFTGAGRMLTDADGCYCFRTIKPGAYPWHNHPNAWRPAHIHFSLFGAGILSRLVTQMYFPGDPLQPLDPILNSIPDERARQRLISRFDIERTEPDTALAFRWDIVLRGHDDTPFESSSQ
jgi:protocatechuate 3,4-dioxygenase, beta subunit